MNRPSRISITKGWTGSSRTHADKIISIINRVNENARAA